MSSLPLSELDSSQVLTGATVGQPKLRKFIAVGVFSLVAMIGTNASGALSVPAPKLAPLSRSTTNLGFADGSFFGERPPRSSTQELRFRYGFSVQEIARLAGVSRRSVYTWLHGGPMRSQKSQALDLIIAIADQSDAMGLQLRTVLEDASSGPSLASMLVRNELSGVARRIERATLLGARRDSTVSAEEIPLRRHVYEEHPSESETADFDDPPFVRVLGVVSLASGVTPLGRA